MIVLGIDPGMNGASCIYDSRDPTDLVAVLDLPTLGEGTHREIDSLSFFRWIIHRNQQPERAFIENVHAMPRIQPDEFGNRPQIGMVQSFRFGMGIGAIRAVVRLTEIPIVLVVPQVWKKTFGLTGSDKEQSRQLALDLFPKAADAFALKKHHQRAEAALIAKHGAKWIGAEL